MSIDRASWFVIPVVGLLMVVPGSAEGQASRQDLVAEGARQYANVCGRCHNLRSPIEHSDRDWVVIGAHMRARAGLTGEQIRRIVAFLQASNQMEDPGSASAREEPAGAPTAGVGVRVSTDADVVADGRELFETKGCVACHGPGPGGGRIAPELTGVVQERGAAAVARTLRDPTWDNPGSLMPDLGLTEEEIRALVSYLATLE